MKMNAKFFIYSVYFSVYLKYQIIVEFSTQQTPFLSFNREQWAELRKSVPLKLTEQDLKPLFRL